MEEKQKIKAAALMASIEAMATRPIYTPERVEIIRGGKDAKTIKQRARNKAARKSRKRNRK